MQGPHAPHSPRHGIGGSADHTGDPGVQNGSAVARGLRTPGMIVFAALAVVSMIATYFIIMFMDPEALL